MKSEEFYRKVLKNINSGTNEAPSIPSKGGRTKNEEWRTKSEKSKFKVQQPSFKAHAAVMLTKEASENVCLIIVLQTFTDPSTTLRMTETAWTWNHQTSLHPLIIISTFLFPLYFIKGERFATGRFMHKYTVYESRKMLMECVIAVGNKVANVLMYEINLKSGQIILKR